MDILTAIGHALWMAFTMWWDIFWGLALGFLFSTIIEVAVSKAEAEKGIAGAMEGHATMSMGEQHGSWKARTTSKQGWVSVSHYYVMNWVMLWRDIIAGLLVAGALGAWVPHDFWKAFFLVDHPVAAMVWGGFPEPEHRGAKEFGVSADKIILPRPVALA